MLGHVRVDFNYAIVIVAKGSRAEVAISDMLLTILGEKNQVTMYETRCSTSLLSGLFPNKILGPTLIYEIKCGALSMNIDSCQAK